MIYHNNMKFYIFSFLLLLGSAAGAAEWQQTLQSPDGKLEMHIYTKGQLAYSLHRNGRTLISKSLVGLQIDGHVWGENPKVASTKKRNKVKESIDGPHYRFSSIEVVYNALNIKLKDHYGIEFRAYDEGVAYRFYTTSQSELCIEDEVADINFPQDYPVFISYSTVCPGGDQYAMAFQNLYTRTTVQGIVRNKIAFLPVTMDCGDGLKLTLLESDLERYPGMFVRSTSHNACSIKGTFAAYPTEIKEHGGRAMTRVDKRAPYIAKVDGTRTFPWRIWAVTEKDTQMPTNNLVYALASPNRIGDTSWITTGKAAWEWWNDCGLSGVDFKAGINTATYKHYIDFAARNKIEFVVLDEGWYYPRSGDMLTVVPRVNLKELVAYGKQKGVKLILWTVFNVLDSQLEAACKKYAEMGVSGFKVDFLDRDDQTAVEMTYRIAEITAKYHLILDLHGFYKPTGLERTYPNIVNFEAVFGMEEMKWNSVKKDMMEYDVTMPYIRMMAGPVDYQPGAMRNGSKKDFRAIYNNPMSQGTRCHQLAAYIVHDSPFTMLSDSPTLYAKEQEFTDFIVSIPNKRIDETRVLWGTLGENIVSARRVGANWYVGGMTDWTERDITLDFSFLGEGIFEVTLFRDGVNANEQASDYRKEVFIATKHSTQKIHLAQGGGFAMTIIKR